MAALAVSAHAQSSDTASVNADVVQPDYPLEVVATRDIELGQISLPKPDAAFCAYRLDPFEEDLAVKELDPDGITLISETISGGAPTPGGCEASGFYISGIFEVNCSVGQVLSLTITGSDTQNGAGLPMLRSNGLSGFSRPDGSGGSVTGVIGPSQSHYCASSTLPIVVSSGVEVLLDPSQTDLVGPSTSLGTLTLDADFQ